MVDYCFQGSWSVMSFSSLKGRCVVDGSNVFVQKPKNITVSVTKCNSFIFSFMFVSSLQKCSFFSAFKFMIYMHNVLLSGFKKIIIHVWLRGYVQLRVLIQLLVSLEGLASFACFCYCLDLLSCKSLGGGHKLLGQKSWRGWGLHSVFVCVRACVRACVCVCV